MPLSTRITWALALVLIDAVAFAVPLVALGVAWVLLARPPWLPGLVARLYADAEPRA